MKIIIKLFLMIFVFGITNEVYSQWEVTNGPSQPKVLSLEKNGIYIFSAARDQVSRTSNGGITWTPVSVGLKGNIYSLRVIDEIILAAAAGNIFQSSNNGDTWTNTSSGLPGYDIKHIYVESNNIYASTFGVYKSENSGLNWSKLNLTWDAFVNSIAISGNTIIAATVTDGCYLSNDNGATWENRSSGLPSNVNSILFENSRLIAGTDQGIYYSDNNGDNWQLTNLISSIYSIEKVNNKLFACSYANGGVFSSNDGGVTWISNNNGLTDLNVYSIIDWENNLFIGTNSSVWKRDITEIITSVNNSTQLQTPQISPNPGNGIFNISNCENMTVEVFNYSGKKVGDYIYKSSDEKITIYENGILIFIVTDQTGNRTVIKRINHIK